MLIDTRSNGKNVWVKDDVFWWKAHFINENSVSPNQLSAKGKIDKQILMDVEVNFPDFAKTVPDLAGKMQGNVALRGNSNARKKT